MRRSPFYAREEALGAVFFDARGWERPQWYESNADLMEKLPRPCEPRQHEWDARWWSPITNAEHLHMRERVGMVDLTAFNEFDFDGPGALAFLQYMCVNNVDVPVGRSVYTPLLTPHGGFRGDLTIMRLGEQHFRVITGAFDGGRDKYWFTRYMPTDGSVTFTDRTSGICTIGVWGPNAEATMAKIVTGQSKPYDVSQAGFPYGAVRDVLIDGVPCTMFRISYVGENGWEIYTNMEHGLRLWDTDRGGRQGVRHPPRRHRRVRRHRPDREGLPADGRRARERVQPGRGRAGAPEGEVGRLHRQGGLPQAPATPNPAAIMCTLSMDDHTQRRRHVRYPTGGNEPILTLDGERIVDANGRVSRVDDRRRRTVARHVPAARLPPAGARGRGHQAAGRCT